MKNIFNFLKFVNENYKFDKLSDQEQNILLDILSLYEKESNLIYQNVDRYPTISVASNPYHACKYCGVTQPEIDSSGHLDDCEWLKLYNSFDMLLSQLPKDVQNNLDYYLGELQLDEKLNFDSLPKSNKKDIKLNLKFRILEIKKSIKDGNLKSIDKRIILRQFKNEFTEELIDNIEFEKFVDELNDILKEGKPYSKHINKYLNKIKNY